MVTNRIGRKGGKDSAEITCITIDNNLTHQNPFPSLNLTSRRSNLSQALSLKHANEPAGFYPGDPLLVL
jgi:hypothetical protein